MAKMSKRGMTKRFLITEMDRSIKRMLKLIEEEGDSFAKKAEIYYQKRPVLVSHVEEFYRMFRSLAERYDNATSELKRMEIRSQGSGGVTEAISEPPSTITSPDNRLTRRLSGTRTIAYFDMLGNNKEGYETSTLDSDSDSDDSLFNSYSSASNYGNYRRLRKKITELEAELRKVQIEHEESRSSVELAYYEEELRIAKEKIRSLEEEIGKLRKKLEKYELIGPRHNDFSDESVEGYENRFYAEEDKVVGSKEEIKRLRQPNARLQSNQKERESGDRIKLEVPKRLSKQNSHPQEQISKLLKVRAFDDNIREWEWCRSLEEDLKRIGIKKTEMEEEIEELKAEREALVVKVSELEEETSIKDEQIDQMNERLQKLDIECEKSSKSIEELRCRSRELETCIEKQQEVIEEGAEEKRQAVRQLCISLEHYRNAYQMLRQDLLEQRKPVMAS